MPPFWKTRPSAEEQEKLLEAYREKLQAAFMKEYVTTVSDLAFLHVVHAPRRGAALTDKDKKRVKSFAERFAQAFNASAEALGKTSAANIILPDGFMW